MKWNDKNQEVKEGKHASKGKRRTEGEKRIDAG